LSAAAAVFEAIVVVVTVFTSCLTGCGLVAGRDVEDTCGSMFILPNALQRKLFFLDRPHPLEIEADKNMHDIDFFPRLACITFFKLPMPSSCCSFRRLGCLSAGVRDRKGKKKRAKCLTASIASSLSIALSFPRAIGSILAEH